MAQWTTFPHVDSYPFDAASLRSHWPRLHAGDAEPVPADDRVLAAWVLFHRGAFQQAAEAGLHAGGDGITVANKATCIYANYLEKREQARLDLLLEVVRRAEAQAAADAENPNAWYWQAYALGRYSQGISVARALAQGLGNRVKEALERTIALQPRHADAHIALGAFHAEVIDKVGTLIGGMTYGAKRETALRLFQDGLTLHPASAGAMIEYANALLMLDGHKRIKQATQLYAQAARSKPMDARERLDVELAKAELAD
jgi:tetratricopeptide (TPR) repeat protein